MFIRKKFYFAMAGEGEGGAGGAGDGGQGAGDGEGRGDREALIASAREAAKAAGTHLVDDWREALPEDIATDGSLASFKDWRDIPKSYIHARKNMSKDKVPLPGENATPEEWNEFFKKVGRPDDPTGYELGAPDELPEGYQYPKPLEDDFRKWAHENGLNAKQTKGMWAKITERTINHHKDNYGKMTQQRKADHDALMSEWGANHKAINAKVSETFNALNRMLGAENAMPKEMLDNPKFKRLFKLIGDNAQEDKLGAGGGGSSDTMTAREAESKIDEFKASDEGQIYYNPRHPKNKAMVAAKRAMVDKWFKIAYDNKPES